MVCVYVCDERAVRWLAAEADGAMTTGDDEYQAG